jgi:putative peptidoglycan lipid II flippase
MAVGTIASRLTGLLRVLAATYALGITETRLADTFNVANTLPNILYELILGGVLSSVFIPIVVEALREDDGLRRVGVLVGTSLFVLAAFAAFTSLLSPLIVRIVTFRGGAGAGSQSALSGFLFRFFAFQILFYGAAALYGGILNARGRFGVVGFAPVANNVVSIVVFVVFAVSVRHRDVDLPLGGKILLGAGTTLAVAAMAIAHVVAVRRAVGRIPLRARLSDPLVRRFARLSAWTGLYVATSQFEATIHLALAYGVQGGASAYLTAFTFFQLPYGVLAVSVMTPLVPLLADRAADGDMDGFRSRLEQGVNVTVAVVLPASVAYAIAARPAMRVLLQRGQTTAVSADYVGRLVAILTVGLVFYSLWLLFLRAFYALQDAKTPVVVNLVEVGVFLLLDFTLYPLIKVEGLAWVHTLGYAVGAVVAGVVLDRRIGPMDWDTMASVFLRVLVDSVVMGLVVWGIIHGLGQTASLVGQFAVLVLAAVLGGLVFLAGALLLDIDEVLSLIQLVKRRRPSAPGPPLAARP